MCIVQCDSLQSRCNEYVSSVHTATVSLRRSDVKHANRNTHAKPARTIRQCTGVTKRFISRIEI